MNSRITITFNSVPSLDTLYSFSDSLTGTTLIETFKDARTQAGESERNTGSLQLTANNYRNAIDLDYNITSLYQIGVLVTEGGEYTVVILANNPNSQFTEVSNTTSGAVTVVIENSIVNNFAINNVSISEADTDPCNNVKVTVDTEETATNITLPISQAVSTNPFVFNYSRQASFFKIKMNKDSVSDETTLTVPKLLSADFEIQTIASPTNNSINVARINPQGALTFEYSLDNSNWQTSNAFNGLTVGSYTLYIRDNIGCSISMDFEVSEFSPVIIDYDEIAEVSNLNPIRFKKVEDWTNCGIQRNIDNTLSYEENVSLNYRNFTQKFQKCDIVKTQIKTNYLNVSARLIGCNDEPTEANENLLLYSEQMDNAYWTKDDVTVTTEAEGTADKIIAQSFSGLKTISTLTNKDTVAKTYTLSAYVKAVEYSRVYIRLTNEDLSGGYAGFFNLNNQTFTYLSGSWVSSGNSITDEGNGWYRISITATTDATDKIESVFGIVDDSDSPFFTGDNTSGILIHKTQLREGSLSPYLVTTDSQATTEAEEAGTELTVTQMTANMNYTDVRDATAFQILSSDTYNTYLGIRFGTGNTYDSVTLQQNGSYINDLPSWLDVGEYVNLQGYGWFQILDIINQSQYNEPTVVLNQLFSNTTVSVLGENVVTTSMYNIVNYERYEFAIDMSSLEGYYQVKIELTDDDYEDVTFLSEWLDIREEHAGCHVIKYYNSENNEINYNTGFTGVLRLPYIQQLKSKPNEEQDVFVDDNNTVLLDAKLRFFSDFSLRPLPTGMKQKVALVMSQDRLFIDDINYLKIGELDVQPLGNTNEYLVKGTLVRADHVFNNSEYLTTTEVITVTGSPVSLNLSGDALLFAE